jgi:hypothetical protein
MTAWKLVGMVVSVAMLVPGGCRQPELPVVSFDASRGDMAVVTADLSDTCAPAADIRATAFGVWVDGNYVHEAPAFAGAGQPRLETLVGPLPPGPHTIDFRPSSNWAPVPCLRVVAPVVRLAGPGTPAYTQLRFTPTLELRADTVGENTDVPLYAYVEKTKQGELDVLTYTTVFSNEDGGTPARALYARWGRATDIEQVYEVTLRGKLITREEFQGPDHEIRPFEGRRKGGAPVLLVATLNNMVTDRGRGLVRVRLAPAPVTLDHATRESTLDDRPWAMRVMAAEQVRERRISNDEAPGAGGDAAWLKRAPLPERFVYFEARVARPGLAVAAWIDDGRGTRRYSDYGHEKLAVDRDGWVRVAVPAGSAGPAAVVKAGWICRALPADQAEATPAGTCTIDATRVFTISRAGVPGPSLTGPASATLRAGEVLELPAAATTTGK